MKVVAEIRAKADRMGVSVHRLFKLAGVDPSTFTRWKAGADPLMGTFERVINVAESTVVVRKPRSDKGKKRTNYARRRR